MARVRQHVNPLKSDLLNIPLEPVVCKGSFLEVELGAGEAEFLLERALAEPLGAYVGVEIRRPIVDRANAAAAARGLKNVQTIFANMSVDLPRIFAPKTVRRFHLNFPDPWFKTRQHKRRVMGPALVETLRPLLMDGGELHVATDIFDIALDAMTVLESFPSDVDGTTFRNVREPWAFLPDNPFGAKSLRERHCEAQGLKIWRLLYRLESI